MYERKPVENLSENQIQDMPERMTLESLDIAAEKREQLKQLFPEVFNEDKVDFERLQRVLGEQIDTGRERYGLTWPGKAECMKVIQEPSRATLKPCREESVNFDDTENLFIEGDNLEVLKLLQKSYCGKVKMIYIDPPYNTGKEFIYPDNFKESIETYLAYAGLVDANGKKFTTNTATEGRFHSKWLNMMYPRLYLAKNLLREDGVIFISINDKEVQNLRKVCDEIFGEENFLASPIWDKNHSAQAGVFKAYHEYIFVYAKNAELIDTPKVSNGELFEAGAMKRESNRHPKTEFTFPAGVRFNAPDGFELRGEWGGIESVSLVSGRMVAESGLTTEPVTLKAAYTQKNQMQEYFYGDRDNLRDSRGQKIAEFYFTSSGKVKVVKERGVETPQTTLNKYGSQGTISTDLAELFGIDQTPFDNPKPVSLIKDFIKWFSYDSEDIVLDFFLGSATTCHAVMQLNIEDGKSRKYIGVQLPESCREETAAHDFGFKTIADLSKERIRLSASRLSAESPKAVSDLGFKVYKLDRSHFGQWQSEIEPGNVTQLQANLELHSSHISEEAEQEALLYELLLKAGFSLTESIEQKTLGNQTVFSAVEGALLICLENTIEPETIEKMVEAKPAEIIVKDSAFAGNDQLKVNAVQTVKAYNRNSETDIVFKVV